MSEQSLNTIPETELSLKDIIDFLVESWKIIFLVCAIGGLLGLGYAVKVPALYKATAFFQVGKVAGEDVEAPATLIEKLKIPTYYSQKTFVSCGVMNELLPGEEIVKTIKATLVKTSPIITISYIDKSPEIAKNCLATILDDIIVSQQLSANSMLKAKNNELLSLKLKLESTEKIMKGLANKNINFDFDDSKFSASTLFLVTTLSKENEIKDLRKEINNLEVKLTDPQTKEAFLIAPIYAPQKKVSPNIATGVAFGLSGGLFLGFLVVMGRRSYRLYMASNQS